MGGFMVRETMALCRARHGFADGVAAAGARHGFADGFAVDGGACRRLRWTARSGQAALRQQHGVPFAEAKAVDVSDRVPYEGRLRRPPPQNPPS